MFRVKLPSILISCLVLCPAVLCDYQVEILLVQYSNPTGQLADGGCCDLDAEAGSCSLTETCDVQFIFGIQNLDSNTRYDSMTLAAERYDNTNQISFRECATLPSPTSNAASNPLTYTIPSNDWTGTQTLRMTATIQDYDPPAGTMGVTLQEIAAPFIDIQRTSSLNNAFSTTSPITRNSVTMMIRYRVICTAGTCGDDCSQTTGCTQWTPACDAIRDITTPPPNTAMPTSASNPCFPINPCNNGGACIAVAPGVFSCRCASGYDGDTCDEMGQDAPTEATIQSSQQSLHPQTTPQNIQRTTSQTTPQSFQQMTTPQSPQQTTSQARPPLRTTVEPRSRVTDGNVRASITSQTERAPLSPGSGALGSVVSYWIIMWTSALLSITLLY